MQIVLIVIGLLIIFWILKTFWIALILTGVTTIVAYVLAKRFNPRLHKNAGWIIAIIAFCIAWPVQNVIQDASNLNANREQALAERQHAEQARQNHLRRLAWNIRHPREVAARRAAVKRNAAARQLAAQRAATRARNVQLAATGTASLHNYLSVAAANEGKAVTGTGIIATPDQSPESFYASPRDHCSMIDALAASGRSDSDAFDYYDRPLRQGEFANGTRVAILKHTPYPCHAGDTIFSDYDYVRSDDGRSGWVTYDHVQIE